MKLCINVGQSGLCVTTKKIFYGNFLLWFSFYSSFFSLSFLTVFMNFFTLFSFTSFLQSPCVLKLDPIIKASAFKYSSKFSNVIPDPIKTGNFVLLFNSDNSSRLAGTPVDVPVNIIPSERKKSAAFAVSARETSLVMLCELIKKLFGNYKKIHL